MMTWVGLGQCDCGEFRCEAHALSGVGTPCETLPVFPLFLQRAFW